MTAISPSTKAASCTRGALDRNTLFPPIMKLWDTFATLKS